MRTRVATKAAVFRRLQGVRPRLAALGITSVGLFGSFVRGEQSAASNVDLLVEFAPAKHTFDNFMEAAFLLEDVLGRRVELVTPASLSPHLGPHILREVERVAITA